MLPSPNKGSITVITQPGSCLSKTLDTEGNKARGTKPGTVYNGRYDTYSMDLEALTPALDAVQSDQVWITGRAVDGSLSGQVVSVDNLKDNPGAMTRTEGGWVDSTPTFQCMDVDYGQAPQHIIDTDLIATIQHIVGGPFGYVKRASTSSGVMSPFGTPVGKNSTGCHIYALTEFNQIEIIFNRLILAGLGFAYITEAGVTQIRTPLDLKVKEPYWLLFEGAAVLPAGFTQTRKAEYVPGPMMGTIAPLTEQEAHELAETMATIKLEAAPRALIVKQARSEKLGIPMQDYDKLIDGSSQYLPASFVLTLASGELVTVAEVYEDKERFRNKGVMPPMEPDYPSEGRFYLDNPDGNIVLSSLAHGTKATYKLGKPVNVGDDMAEVLQHQEPPGSLILPSDHHDNKVAARQIFETIGATKTMFNRGNKTVEISKENTLDVVTPSMFISRLDGYGVVLRHAMGSKGVILKTKRCSDSIAKTLLSSTEAGKFLPTIQQVTTNPIINPEGGVLQKGYHPCGTYVMNGEQVPEVPLVEAVAALKEILEDFDFMSPGDEARALASLVTPALVMGGHFKGPAPLDVAEADVSQSGKTFRQELVRAIYGEEAQFIGQRQGGVGSLDESLQSAIMSGKPFITLDTYRKTVNSALLEMILTAVGTVEARAPHKGSVNVDATRSMFQLSSNGLSMTRDLANRSSITRIRKQARGYKFKKWGKLTVKDHIDANQAYYLGCAFSIVKEWIAKGKQQAECDHDRKEWGYTLNWVSMEIFKSGDLMQGHRAIQNRIGSPDAAWLRELSLKAKEFNVLYKPMSTSQLVEFCLEQNIAIPGVGFSSAGIHLAMSQKRRVGAIMKNAFDNGEADTVEVDCFMDQGADKSTMVIIDAIGLVRIHQRGDMIDPSRENNRNRMEKLYYFRDV